MLKSLIEEPLNPGKNRQLVRWVSPKIQSGNSIPRLAALLAASALALRLFTASADHGEPAPFRQDIQAEDLAQRAFEIVEQQVRAATTQVDTGWSSQPGAVRTFHVDGSLSRIYKLYSASNLLATSTAEAHADLPAEWDRWPTRFVDLNEPSTSDGKLVFPIADPRVTPEGFSYSNTINGVVIPGEADTEDERRLPMPVQWIYLLRDGTRGYLNAENRFIGAVVPTVENPIVGRIAFWADDNTSKININTASEGVFWDYPRTDTIEDRGLANSQPAQGEYQRHPGHPAMVCLSSVMFPGKRIGTPEGGSGAMAPLTIEEAQLLWWISPGVGSGGSAAGTVPFGRGLDRVYSDGPFPRFPNLNSNSWDGLPEIFDLRRERGFTDQSEVEERLERSGFHITTLSNAPELNLAGHPRVCVWPISDDPSVVDSNFDMISTIGEKRFALTRSAGSGASRSRHNFYYAGNGNNLSLFNYLNAQTSRPSTGFERALADKYGQGSFSDRQQILTIMFDYIRGINLSGADGPEAFSEDGQVSAICMCGGHFAHRDRFYQTDLADGLGMGRTFTISELALVFYCSGWIDSEGNSDGSTDGLSPGEKKISAGLVTETFCPAHGFAFITPEFGIRLGYVNLPLAGQSATMSNPSISVGEITGEPTQPLTGGHAGSNMHLDHVGNGISWNDGVVVPIDQPTLEFGGLSNGSKLTLYDSTNFTSGSSVQSIELNFPQTEIPSPAIDQNIGDWWERLYDVRQNDAPMIRETDTVRSLVVGHGDYRLMAGTRAIPHNALQPHPDYDDTSKRFAHSLLKSTGEPDFGASFERELLPDSGLAPRMQADMPLSPSSQNFAPLLADSSYPFPMDPAITGDFDNGFGNTRDGPYINKPEDGIFSNDDGAHYFQADAPDLTEPRDVEIFSPHRLMPGPGMFGSLPSGIRAGVPWRTLLFRPDPQHFGSTSPADHLWLDLFRMPTPLPDRNGFSFPDRHGWKGDELSSDGKINLNYQILPFGHIERSTAVRAALKAEKITAIPTTDGAVYKSPGGPESYRHFIDADETLQQWESKFSNGDFFRSASEICEMYLVPEGQQLGTREGQDYPTMRQFWNAHKLTGDNTKERPYTALYQHFTTRSNSFDVAVIAQTVTKSEAGNPEIFNPQLDAIGDSYRGSGTLSRAIDPATVPDLLSDPTAGSLDPLYSYEYRNISPAITIKFEILEISLNPRPTITWSSFPGDTYVVQRSIDLGAWTDIATVHSTGESTAYYDRTAPGGRVFYRITRE